MNDLCCAEKKSGDICRKPVKFLIDGKKLCGIHAKGADKKDQVAPKKAKKPEPVIIKSSTVEDHWKSVQDMQINNKRQGHKGKIMFTSYEKGKYPPLITGYERVYVNSVAITQKKISIVATGLDPCNIGPIKHGQKGLPHAVNLDTLYKACIARAKDVSTIDGVKTIKSEFFLNQVEDMKKDKLSNAGKFDCFVWRVPAKTEGAQMCPVNKVHYVRVDLPIARQIFAILYQRSIETNVNSTSDYLNLTTRLDEGYNLQLMGKDEIDEKKLDDRFWEGELSHESIIYTMLVWKMNNRSFDTLPWNRKTINFKV